MTSDLLGDEANAFIREFRGSSIRLGRQMGHGDRGGLFGGAQHILTTYLPKALDGDEVFAGKLRMGGLGLCDMLGFNYFPDSHRDIGFTLVERVDHKCNECAATTFFLFLRPRSQSVRCRVTAIGHDCQGAEGIISVGHGDGYEVTFFDPRYIQFAQQCAVSMDLRVRYAALVYRIHLAEHHKLVISDPHKVARIRSRRQGCAPEDITDFSPIVIQTDQLASYAPGVWDDANNDDFRFQGPLEDLREIHFLGQKIYVGHMTFRLAMPKFRCTLYIPETAVAPGVNLEQGVGLVGTAWLQGHYTMV